ncbi:MAG: DUF4166 domain-containing protein [Pseudorhodoferax sp.]
MSAPSMYEQVLGEAFDRLPAAVQRFHRLRGDWTLAGQAQTQAPASVPARLLAWALGTPRSATSGTIRFELSAEPRVETWTRHFPAQTMRSTLRLAGAELHEVLGASRLRFQLLASPTGLEMRLIGLHFMGIPCPRWLMPEVVAREHGDGRRIEFHVAARVRGIGQVASYRGHLDLPEESAR